MMERARRANKKNILGIVEAHSPTRENINKNTSAIWLLDNIQWNNSG